MANEFIIKKGFHSKADSQVTGSLNISATASAGYIKGTVVSGSYVGYGGNLTGVQAFPFTGDAQITGSLTISGSLLAFTLDSDDVVLGIGAGATMRAGGNQSVSYNVLIGYDAGNLIDQYGTHNIAIGYKAGTGDANQSVAIGSYAAHKFAYGKKGNTGVGYWALSNGGGTYITSQTTGEYNTAIGHTAGRNICTGIGNTMLGAYAGRNFGGYNAGGDGNIAVGHYAGFNQTTGDGNITIGSGSLGVAGESNQLRIGSGNSLTTISASLLTGDIIFPSTASAQYYSTPAGQISSISASYAITASYVNIESLPLVNPIVQYITTTALTSSGDTVTTPGSLTFVSSSTYEYLEIFINGLRLRYDVDFVPASTSTVKYLITIPSGSEVTYKSLKRP